MNILPTTLAITFFFTLSLIVASCSIQKPTVEIKPYAPAAGLDAAQWIAASYIDDALTQQEIHMTSSASDAYVDFQKRISRDNGRTWDDFFPIDRVTQQLPGGGFVTFPGKHTYDPKLDILYQVVMRRMFPGRELYDYTNLEYVDHTLASENGKDMELKYEHGPSYQEDSPFDPKYLATNRAYMGQRVTVAKDGTAYLPIVCFKKEHQNGVNQGGIVLMTRDPKSGDWSASNQQYISPNVSSRGLLEPEVAILKNGDLLIVCRGSNSKGLEHTIYPDSLEARKWFLTSKDGGETLSPVKELKYADGSRFYSPSAIHSFVRSTKNGKLYWIANIVEVKPDGNSPRYPLCLAEIDETIPAVIKNSTVVIDDKEEGQMEEMHLSNFSQIENRETKNIEILMTKIGEIPDHFWQGAVYKYIIKVPRK